MSFNSTDIANRSTSVDAACIIRPCSFLQEARGLVPRLNASVEQPFGPHDIELSPLCAAFRTPGVKTVAIVGNGPLDHAQRKDIDACNVVVRCAKTLCRAIIAAPRPVQDMFGAFSHIPDGLIMICDQLHWNSLLKNFQC